MNFRTTGVILGIFALLLGLWFFSTQREETQDTKASETLSQRYAVERSAVQKITLQYADEAFTAFTLVRENDDWWISEPIQADADDDKVSELLRDLLDKKIKRTLEAPSDLGTYGLGSPGIVVAVWTVGSNPVATFHVGDKTVSYSVYVREDDVPDVHTVESSILDDLTKSPSDMRERKLLAIEQDRVQSMRLDVPGQQEIVLKRVEQAWELEQPLAAPADNTEVQDILDALKALKAETFESDQISDGNAYGFPGLVLEVRLANEQHQLHIGGEIPGTQRVYATLDDQGMVYGLDAALKNIFTRSVFDLRDKQVIDFQRIDVRRFEIVQGRANLVCEKGSDGTWSIKQPQALKADSSIVDDFLFQLDSLKAVEFVDDAPSDLARYGLQPARTQVRVFVLGEDTPVVLQLGDKQDARVFAKGDRPSVYLVSQEILQHLIEGTAAFRDRTFWELDTSNIKRLSLSYGDIQVDCAKQGTTWQITGPIQQRADVTAIQDLLDKVTTLRANRYVQSATGTGLNQPRLRLMLTSTGGQTRTLLLGSSAGSGEIYAQSEGDSMILVLPESLLGDLRKTVEDLREKAS